MNTELSPEITRTSSNTHGKIANNNSSQTWQKQHQVAMFRAIKQHVTKTYDGKQRHVMNLIISYNKSPLLTMSQKVTENMMAPK